jgi:membrane-associated phospholipid phosphatase
MTPLAVLGAVAAWFGIVLGCVVAAGDLLASAERADGSTGFDRSITSWVAVHRTHAVTALARSLSAVGSQKVLIPSVAIVVSVLLWRRRFALAALLVVVWGGAIGLYSVAKHLVGRPRPPARLWLEHVAGKSFPSGHAVQSLATFAALALVLAVVLRRTRWPAMMIAVALAAGVGWSRVYLGVHWTTDVFAGWLAAAAWAAAVACVAARRRVRGARRR